MSPWPARILGLRRRQLFTIYVLGGSLGIVLAVTLFTLHVSRLVEEQSRLATRLLSSLASQSLGESSPGNMLEIMRTVNEIQVPFIMTDNAGRPLQWNARVIGIPMPERLADLDAIDPAHPRDPALRRIRELVRDFDREHEPFAIVDPASGRRMGTLHYGSSTLSRQIRWMPYLELTLLVAFFLLIVWAMLMKKEGEQQRLFAGMAKETAHQLGTPLTAMMGWLQILHDRHGDGDEVIAELGRDVNRLIKVAERFSRIGSQPRLESGDLTETVRSTLVYFERRLPHLGGRVDLRLEGAIRNRVLFNRELLEWVLENLIKNGIDALKDGRGTIVVRLDDGPGAGITLQVSDTGGGVPAGLRNRVFEPGFTTKTRGWGMGLALVRRIVTQYHGGRIQIAASSPRGTTFAITLPEKRRPTVPFRILWVDDQIDELRAHFVFLTEKGYAVEGAANGRDALAMLSNGPYDAILLDEMMPGLGGLETLAEIKKIDETVPVIMVTKSEAEDLLTRAIGRRIDDYLVKPVSPVQVLSVLKKTLEGRRIRGEQVTRDYLAHFGKVADRVAVARTPQDWVDLYVDLTTWGLELFTYSDLGLRETHAEQMSACNQALARYVRERYSGWVNGEAGAPLLSPKLFATWVEPEIAAGRQVFLIVIDCMRLDQWRFVEPLVEPYFRIEKKYYWSILPSATPFSRNALFSGLYPLELARRYPDWWKGSSQQEHSKNAHEEELLGEQLRRLNSPAAESFKYYKMFDARDTDNLRRQIGSLGGIRLVAGVYNFLDIMAHGRSQSAILKELAPDEAAFRSLMSSWFEHSSLFEVLKQVARRDCTVLITTDHGSMFCRRASLVKGNRETSTNVRYKYGDNLVVDDRQVFLLKSPEQYMLPRQSPIENYAVTTENYYLVYPTNFHEYERLYRNSFQHGGISLEELICPFVVLRPRG